MRKIICDRCGAEIPNGTRIGYVAVNWRAASDNSLMQDNPYEEADFCEKCMEDIARVIDFKIISAPEEEELDQEEEEVVERIQKTPARATTPPDFGKIRELVKAGKSTKEISEIIGKSYNQTYRYIQALKKEYNQGFTGGGVCGGAGNALHAPKEVEE